MSEEGTEENMDWLMDLMSYQRWCAERRLDGVDDRQLDVLGQLRKARVEGAKRMLRSIIQDDTDTKVIGRRALIVGQSIKLVPKARTQRDLAKILKLSEGRMSQIKLSLITGLELESEPLELGITKVAPMSGDTNHP